MKVQVLPKPVPPVQPPRATLTVSMHELQMLKCAMGATTSHDFVREYPELHDVKPDEVHQLYEELRLVVGAAA